MANISPQPTEQKMILIDHPYISPFLMNTIKENQFDLIATEEARLLIEDAGMNWISEKEAKNKLIKHPNPLIYTNSENALTWIFIHLQETKLPEQIGYFKDKFKFRELTKDLFPDFQFRKIKLNDILNLDLEEVQLPFVIKPSLGFFSIGVHIVHTEADWAQVKKELNQDTLKSVYPKEVLDTSTFIIETYLEGEEFAIDAYFNSEGDAVVLNILHHQFSSSTDVSDRVYSTSHHIIRTYKAPVEDFLHSIGKKADLKNFALHVEVRIDQKGAINPIEINPMRFGGWCTTADLAWHAFKFNPYEYYIQNKKPDWERIFTTDQDKIYSLILLNNNSGFEPSAIAQFDFEALEQDFEKVLEIRKIDVHQYPLFGFLFTETTKGNEKELKEILNSNLRKYIRTKV